MSDRQSSRPGARMPPLTEMLVIGYGNDLRGDDGAGIVAATLIAARSPQSRVLMARQLTPELVVDFATASHVVFVDAFVAHDTGAELHIEKIRPHATGAASMIGHYGNPADLIHLAGRLFGSAPEAWVVGIPAFCFDAGETISPETRQRIDEAVALIGGLHPPGNRNRKGVQNEHGRKQATLGTDHR